MKKIDLFGDVSDNNFLILLNSGSSCLIIRLAGINEPITDVYFKGNVRHEDIHPKHSLVGTHTGRRTFICNALQNGMPPNAVMKITGHSDYKAMQPYIDIVSRDVDNMVERFVAFLKRHPHENI